MQKAADRPAKPAQEAPNAKRPPAPEGAGGLSSSRKRGGRPQTKGGTPSGPPSQAPCPRIPAPSPAQRAPGAGGALVSHRVAPAVPSALAGLTSGFGMGPGVPRPPGPPAPGGRCGAGSEGAGLRSGRPGGRTALEEKMVLRTVGGGGTYCVSRRARPISGARLRRSRALHLRPINQVVCLGPYRREGPSRGRLPA